MVKVGFIFLGLAIGGVFLGSCSPFGGASAFHCTSDTQCSPGTCYTDGFCVITDPGCTSGIKYQENSGSMSNMCVGESSMIDAAIDAPTMCTPNSKACFNNAIETCKADGTGFDPQQRVPCALACQGTTPACVAASNVAANDQAMCNANNMAPALAPTAGTVTINANDITCSQGCGGGNNTIARTSATPNNFYCLASITIPAAVTVNYAGNIANGVTLFSSGAVSIAGTINFDGGNANATKDTNMNNDPPGAGGPGGFTGGGISTDNGPGNDGGGPPACAGKAGAVQGTGANAAGGGGGGAGNGAVGGAGGGGRNGQNTAVNGGAAGAATCTMADARPLAGGGGGGSGGDGACGPGIMCGWPGGGGGGALHIASRASIAGAGTISANGGNGFGDNTEMGGGGGGGAGGMILLEAPMVTFSGTLRVNGGNGGATNSGLGGTGGTGGNSAGTVGSSSGATQDRGGAGGGGGGGRIRINANNASCTTGTASPTAACTTGTLRATP